MTPPTPRPAPAVSIPAPVELGIIAQLRDSELQLVSSNVRVRFHYNPADPYALAVAVQEPGQLEPITWTVSREPFLMAALWGVELPGLPGMDFTVHRVVITRSYPGINDRDVPCLRLAMRPCSWKTDYTDDYEWSEKAIYLDIEVSAVVRYFTMLTQLVRVGQEHLYMDIDGCIARLLEDW